MKEYYILGVKVNTIAEHLLKTKLLDFINSEKAHQIATVNPEFIVATQKDKKFLETINNCSISLIDGAGVIKALQYMGHDVSLDDRITGVRLTELLIDKAVNLDLKIMFCMFSEGWTKPEKFFMTIKEKYPSLDFQVADEKNALDKIKLFGPDIVLVGFGAPRQDIWISENIDKMPKVKIAAGVGGTFDFMSGKMKRAPKFMQSFGLEWLWRFILQPTRFFRINRAVIKFPYLVYKNIRKNKKKHAKNKD